MLTANIILLISGFAIATCLYSFSAFWRTRKAAMLLFIFGWMVYIAGFVGTAIHEDMPLWAWPIWAVMVAGTLWGIRSEYRLWQSSQSK